MINNINPPCKITMRTDYNNKPWSATVKSHATLNQIHYQFKSHDDSKKYPINKQRKMSLKGAGPTLDSNKTCAKRHRFMREKWLRDKEFRRRHATVKNSSHVYRRNKLMEEEFEHIEEEKDDVKQEEPKQHSHK